MTTQKVTYKVMKDQREHVLLRPDMYIGSIKNSVVEYYGATFDEKENDIKIEQKNGEINSGLHRIFVEIVSNAIDNFFRSSSTDIQTTKIKINITEEGEISVWNDGLTIEIVVDSETGMYNPEMIFGRLLSSSNFDDSEKRKTSGRNGLGSKVSNIFSKYFKFETFDPPTGKKYIQEWKDNMSIKGNPKITSPKLKNGYTLITFLPDYERFGVVGISKDMHQLFLKNIIDTAMITGVSVFYNNEKIPVKSLKDYAMLYEQNDCISLESEDSKVVLSANSSASWKPVSFVNGVETYDGGTHVNMWTECILRPVLEKINTASKKGGKTLTIKDIRPYFRIFINCNIDNPSFTSQEKTKFDGIISDPSKVILPKHINSILKWDVIKEIKELLVSKELVALKNVEKKRGFKKIEGLDQANLAGGKDSEKCCLVLCEGDSAATMATSGISTGVYGVKGRDYFGILRLRGKVLNVRGKNGDVISKNKEICNLIQALNLKIDCDYTIDKNFKSLSYGKIIILTDADCDGIHIGGLILNFFHCLFPSLLNRYPPFITSMRTPIIRIYYPKDVLEFWTISEYKTYQESNKKKNGEIKYFKGLGTNTRNESIEVFGKKMIEFISDDDVDENINKIFNSKMANKRKTWIENYNPSEQKELVSKSNIQRLNISDFLNNEMILFSIDDCKRSLPNGIDGLKESQRKILYSVFLKNLKYSGKTIKVAQLGGFVSEKTNYHHGEQCLFDTITKMAHNFVGSNNIPLLYRGGMMGSRLELGKDAASARYVYTKADKLTHLLFRQEDEPLLTHIIDDGDKIEPHFFIPIIPMVLVNGVICGIGTGWSCNIPSYNPLDIIVCIRNWLEYRCYEKDEKEEKNDFVSYVFPELFPWYNNFKGTIEKVEKNKFVTKGTIKRKGKNIVVVTELPISLSIKKFKDSLDDLLETKEIKGYKNYSTDNEVHFEIQENELEYTLETLGLTSSLSTNNMVLFTKNGNIKKYDDVDSIIEDFCIVRYEYYIKRREYILKNTEHELNIVTNKMRFLTEVMDGTLVIKDIDEVALTNTLDKRGYYGYEDDDINNEDIKLKKYRYLINMNIRSFTKQKLKELQNNIDKLTIFFNKIKNMSPKDMWIDDIDELEKEYKTP